MHSVKFANRSALLSMSLSLGMTAFGAGCAGGPGNYPLQDSANTTSTPSQSENSVASSLPAPATQCAVPGEGCPCAQEGATAECRGPTIHAGDYTSCAPGLRACENGTWGACVGKAIYQTAGTLSEDYASPCPSTNGVRWGAVTMDGITPGGSQINVRVQSAASDALLDAAPVVALAQFTGANGSWTSPDVDATLLGAGVRSGAWLRVTVELVASAGSTPTVVQWKQSSSCGN